MKARRHAVVVTALVATAMLLPVSAAHAATTAVTSPADGHSFTDGDGQVIRATTSRSSSESRPAGVNARLVAAGGAPVSGTQVVALVHASTQCTGIIPFRTCTDVWEARSGDTPVLFNPATLQPFGNAPSCNGGYEIQVAEAGTDTWAGNEFTISRAPGVPTAVKVTTQSRQATVSWQTPAHPDLTGFDVQQKRPSNGQWETVRTVGKGTTSVTLTNLDPGPIEFRVRAVRGDGFTADGDPAVPCSDTGRDLASPWSSTVSATVPTASTSPSPSPSPSPTDGSTEPGDDQTEPTEESTEPDEESTEPNDDATEPEASPSPTPTTRPRTASRAAPPRVESQERRDVEAPEISQPERRERFFGDDEEYSEELDFGAAPPEDMDREPGTVSIRVPGGLQTVLGAELDLDLILAPMAGGMILLSLGLHLRRWTRLGQE